MSQDEELLPTEPLRTRLDTLHRQVARLPQTTRGKYQTLLAELEAQLQRNTPEPAQACPLLDDIEAISKCIEVELDG